MMRHTCCMTGRKTSLYFRCLIMGTASCPCSVGYRTSGGCIDTAWRLTCHKGGVSTGHKLL